jgi:hypothetical protein
MKACLKIFRGVGIEMSTRIQLTLYKKKTQLRLPNTYYHNVYLQSNFLENTNF